VVGLATKSAGCPECGGTLITWPHPPPKGLWCTGCDSLFKNKLKFHWKIFLIVQAVIFLLLFLVS